MSIGQAAGTRIRERRRRRGLGLVAVVVAAVVLAAGGTYLGLRLTSRTSPAATGLAMIWTTEMPSTDCPPALFDSSWIADGLVVTCSGDGGLTAYRVATGQVAWTWPGSQSSSGTPTLDLMSVTTDDGIGVVGYGTNVDPPGLEHIVGIEVASGRVLWQLQLSLSEVSADSVWVGGGRFAVVPGGDSFSDSGTDVQVYSLSTGILDWSSASQHLPPAGCTVSDDDTITGQWVYAMTSCRGGADQIYQMSLQTGAVIAHAPLSGCVDSPTLRSVGGYVLAVCDPAKHATGAVIIPGGGLRQRVLSWTGGADYLSTLGDDGSATGTAVSGDTLYIGYPIAGSERSNHDLYQIAATDVSTGRMRWVKTSSIPGSELLNGNASERVIGADSSGVLTASSVAGPNSNDYRFSGISLTLMSPRDGTVTYGPGYTYSTALSSPPEFVRAGSILVAFPDNLLGTITAYRIGSWPG